MTVDEYNERYRYWRKLGFSVYDALARAKADAHGRPNPSKPVPAKKIYIVGSLKNPKVQDLAKTLRGLGYDVFDDWHAAGPEADDFWQAYERARGRTFSEALAGAHAQDVFAFDKRNIDASDIVILAMPAGKSGHLEFGYAIGSGKKGIICLDGEPERFDVMYNFATAVVNNLEDLTKVLEGL